MLPVFEIFNSIDGEGCYAGNLSTFIRLAGCNLKCRFCDTRYANDCEAAGVKMMSVEDIISHVFHLSPNCNRVTLTGGEPLLHRREASGLVCQLALNGIHVNIETNGSIPIEHFLSDKTTITMDCKSPSSGGFCKMLGRNYDLLRPHDVLKFVVNEDDFEWLWTFLKFTRPKCQIFISPVFGDCDPKAIVEFLKRMQNDVDMSEVAQRCRAQIQLHKIIWSPEERGV